MRQAIINFLIVTLGMMFHQSLSAQVPFTATSLFPVTCSPVKILDFKVTVSNNKVWLSWTVDDNHGADQFEVERSADGKTFIMAALVFGTGKPGTDHYRFYEKKRKAGMSYRIRMILTNGTIAYSPVIPAKAGNSSME